ncbi:MAG: M48 family metallopeptidase [Prolixibacteraceae bacterium]|nr:M48 family metallopeptidase [Prolixibacteraceae bacterium]
MKQLTFYWLLLISFVLVACSTIPIIGRKQLNLVPESQMVALSLTSYKQFLDTSNVYTSGAQLQMVRNTGLRISRAVEKFLTHNNMADRVNQFNWEFNLVKNETPNAWCMPGGKVVFYDGILPICRTEHGVAVVMGHEIAHAVARHGNERMSHGLVAQFGGMALDVALQQEPEKTRSIFLSAFGIGTQVGVMLPFSRKQEYESDKMGLIFLTMAGYDPNEAIAFWERMAALNGPSIPEFLSSHPIDSKRVEALKKILPEMEQYKP